MNAPELVDIPADWNRWSVVLCKPDAVRRGLVEKVLARIAAQVEIIERRSVLVEPWQVFAHYRDLLINRDTFSISVPVALERIYVGRQVEVALVHGEPGTPSLIRDMLGHFDPSCAQPGTLRADFGADSLKAARAGDRLVENVVHASDDAAAAAREFAIWFGTGAHHLLVPPAGIPVPANLASQGERA
jgi:nucleoside diphosphate kinase